VIDFSELPSMDLFIVLHKDALFNLKDYDPQQIIFANMLNVVELNVMAAEVNLPYFVSWIVSLL
jgi:hypothetical protein